MRQHRTTAAACPREVHIARLASAQTEHTSPSTSGSGCPVGVHLFVPFGEECRGEGLGVFGEGGRGGVAGEGGRLVTGVGGLGRLAVSSC